MSNWGLMEENATAELTKKISALLPHLPKDTNLVWYRVEVGDCHGTQTVYYKKENGEIHHFDKTIESIRALWDFFYRLPSQLAGADTEWNCATLLFNTQGIVELIFDHIDLEKGNVPIRLKEWEKNQFPGLQIQIDSREKGNDQHRSVSAS